MIFSATGSTLPEMRLREAPKTLTSLAKGFRYACYTDHLALHVHDLEACIAFYREFCGMQVVHERSDGGRRVVWLAEPGREKEFIFVMVPGGSGRHQVPTDYSHLGFALESRTAVDAIADQARAAGYLVWEPREEPYPVGYYCGVRDPDGNMVEFSYGQPLGPGAQGYEEHR